MKLSWVISEPDWWLMKLSWLISEPDWCLSHQKLLNIVYVPVHTLVSVKEMENR